MPISFNPFGGMMTSLEGPNHQKFNATKTEIGANFTETMQSKNKHFPIYRAKGFIKLECRISF